MSQNFHRLLLDRTGRLELTPESSPSQIGAVTSLNSRPSGDRNEPSRQFIAARRNIGRHLPKVAYVEPLRKVTPFSPYTGMR